MKEKTQNFLKIFSSLNPISAIFITIFIYFGSQILAGIFISIYGSLAGWDMNKTVEWIEQSSWAQFLFIFLVGLITLGLLKLVLKKQKVTFSDIGIKRPKLKDFAYAVPAYVIYFVILISTVALIDLVFPGVNLDQEQQLIFGDVKGAYLILVFIGLVILPALVEEIMVRGYLYSGIKTKMPAIKAGILTSLIFGIAHLQLGSGAPPLWVAAIDTFLLSLALVWVREKTGNIWTGVGLHFFKNSMAFLALFILPPLS